MSKLNGPFIAKMNGLCYTDAGRRKKDGLQKDGHVASDAQAGKGNDPDGPGTKPWGKRPGGEQMGKGSFT